MSPTDRKVSVGLSGRRRFQNMRPPLAEQLSETTHQSSSLGQPSYGNLDQIAERLVRLGKNFDSIEPASERAFSQSDFSPPWQLHHQPLETRFKAQSHQQTGYAGKSASEESSIQTSKKSRGHKQSRGRGDRVQLKVKNTFAVPRNYRPLVFPASKSKTEEGEDLKPKSSNCPWDEVDSFFSWD